MTNSKERCEVIYSESYVLVKRDRPYHDFDRDKFFKKFKNKNVNIILDNSVYMHMDTKLFYNSFCLLCHKVTSLQQVEKIIKNHYSSVICIYIQV
jgi:hypothetical protein